MLRSMLAVALVILPLGTDLPAAHAQSIDAGRGEVPVVLPSGHGDAPAPLIVLLHGYSSSGARQDAYFGLSALADDYGFVFVAPDGTMEAGGNQNRFWAASPACCNFEDHAVDDSAYLSAVIDAVTEVAAVDPRRVFLVGHSNGGFMAYRFAHEHADRVAAIVSLAGAGQTEVGPAPGNPVHVLQIHGTADATIDYRGGDIQDTRYPGARVTVERWAGYNGCSRSARESGTLDLDRDLPGAETTVSRYTDGCTAGGSAELWRIDGGSHGPSLSTHFGRLVVEWLLGHPKP